MPASDAVIDGGFAIYVHWPFCLAKCPYCDFNSHVRERIDEASWRDALLAELAHYAGRVGKRVVNSIFFGGGTPSLMSPASVEAVIDAVGKHWSFADDVEITLEANPTSVEAEKFAGFAQAGVNRVSMGIQALNDADLKALGREHSVREALVALEIGRQHFKRLSFDLIYTRPDQTPDAWAAELEQALALSAGHLSLYQLTIEEGTAFHTAWRTGRLQLPDDDCAAELYDLTQEMTAAAGLPAYEISNHARPGAESRHNLTYWRGGDYAGIGPGAHGRLTIDDVCYATEQITGPENWLAAVEQDGHGTRRREALTRDIRIEEIIMTGLRLAQGLERRRFEALAGCELEQVFEARTLRPLLAHGLLTLDEAGLRATGEGRLKLNAVLAALLG